MADDTTASDVADRNKARVRASFDAWAAGTGSPFELLADDVVWTINGTSAISQRYEGRAFFMSSVMAPFHARLNGRLRPTVKNIYADGDTVIVFFASEGEARDGKPFRNVYFWTMRFQGDAVVAVEALFDTLAINDLWHRVTPAGD